MFCWIWDVSFDCDILRDRSVEKFQPKLDWYKSSKSLQGPCSRIRTVKIWDFSHRIPPWEAINCPSCYCRCEAKRLLQRPGSHLPRLLFSTFFLIWVRRTVATLNEKGVVYQYLSNYGVYAPESDIWNNAVHYTCRIYVDKVIHIIHNLFLDG